MLSKNFELHQYQILTFAAAGWTGATGGVTSSAVKEVNIIGLNVGFTTVPGPVGQLLLLL